MRYKRTALCISWSTLALITAEPAGAETVSLNGLVINTCILTISTPGTLGMATSGTQLSSEDGIGVPAIMQVVATGAAPTVAFSAPALASAPPAYTGSPTLALKYTSTRGANQAYTSGASNYTASGLLDTVTIHARALDSSGFQSGLYTVATTVTCQQQ